MLMVFVTASLLCITVLQQNALDMYNLSEQHATKHARPSAKPYNNINNNATTKQQLHWLDTLFLLRFLLVTLPTLSQF